MSQFLRVASMSVVCCWLSAVPIDGSFRSKRFCRCTRESRERSRSVALSASPYLNDSLTVLTVLTVLMFDESLTCRIVVPFHPKSHSQVTILLPPAVFTPRIRSPSSPCFSSSTFCFPAMSPIPRPQAYSVFARECGCRNAESRAAELISATRYTHPRLKHGSMYVDYLR